MEDWELLAAYAQRHDGAAFTTLVERHRDWVYWACVRRLRDTSLAEDAAQAVFMVLTRHAEGLAKKGAGLRLERWLHKGVRMAAANLWRRERRRKEREMHAATMKTEVQECQATWQEMEIAVEPALDRLARGDRQVLLLRFYRHLTHAEIGGQLTISEEAATKRVNRALERLRKVLAASGVQAGAAAIGPALWMHAAPPLPAAVAAKLSLAGIAGKAAGSAKAAAVAQSLLHTMQLTKILTVACVALSLAIGATLFTAIQAAGDTPPAVPVPIGATLVTAPARVVNIQLVPVGNPGNAPDPATGFGAVSYNYNIGKFDVTVGQYTAFLNAVARTDTYGLYNANMANPTSSGAIGCGIVQSGSPGSYTYRITKNADYPVTWVSFWDACRFTNWLQNGRPTGVSEGIGTTETGAYDLTNAAKLTNNTVVRTAGATWAVASENEWYKAAYFDPTLNAGSGGYWLYPTRSNSAPSNVLSATGTNNANYQIPNVGYTDPVNYLTPVGAFAASPSYYGTFDQGGNVNQWNDTVLTGTDRGERGGSFGYYGNYALQSGDRSTGYFPAVEGVSIGFRVSSVPQAVP